MNDKTAAREKIRFLTRLGILIAIIVLMGFTPVGYLKIGAVEITFIIIPVAIGAVTVGPVGGAVLGAVFGITSFIQCFGMSAFGGTLLGINPVLTFIECIVPRVLCGLIPGLVYKAISKNPRGRYAGAAAACLLTPVLNTVLFIGGLFLMFYPFMSGMMSESGKTFLLFVASFVGINGAIEAAVGFTVGSAVSAAVLHYTEKSRREFR